MIHACHHLSSDKLRKSVGSRRGQKDAEVWRVRDAVMEVEKIVLDPRCGDV